MTPDFSSRTTQTNETHQTEMTENPTDPAVAEASVGTTHIHQDEVSVGLQEKATGMADAKNQPPIAASDRPILGTPDEQMLNAPPGESELPFLFIAKYVTSTAASFVQTSDDDDTLAGMARKRKAANTAPSTQQPPTNDPTKDGDTQSTSSNSKTTNLTSSKFQNTGTSNTGNSGVAQGSADDTGVVVEQPEAQAAGSKAFYATAETLVGLPDNPDNPAYDNAQDYAASAGDVLNDIINSMTDPTTATAGTTAPGGIPPGTNVGGVPPKNADGTYDFFSTAYAGSGNLDPSVLKNLQATIAEIQGKTKFSATEAQSFQSFLSLVTAALLVAQQMTQTLSKTETDIAHRTNALGADLAKQILKCMNETIQKVREAAEAAKKSKMWGIIGAIGGVLLGAIITACTLGAGAPVGAIIAAVVITSAMAAITIADACTGVITAGLVQFVNILTNGFNDLITKLNNGKPLDPAIGKALAAILIIAVVVAMVVAAKSPSGAEGMMAKMFGEAGAKIVTSQIVVATIQVSVMLVNAGNAFGELVKAFAKVLEQCGVKVDQKAVDLAAMIVQLVCTVLASFLAVKVSAGAIEAGAKAATQGSTTAMQTMQRNVTLFASFAEAGLQTTTGVAQYKLNSLQADIAKQQGEIDAMKSFLESLQSNNSEANKAATEAMEMIMDAIQTYVQTITGVRQDETTMANAAVA